MRYAGHIDRCLTVSFSRISAEAVTNEPRSGFAHHFFFSGGNKHTAKRLFPGSRISILVETAVIADSL